MLFNLKLFITFSVSGREIRLAIIMSQESALAGQNLFISHSDGSFDSSEGRMTVVSADSVPEMQVVNAQKTEECELKAAEHCGKSVLAFSKILIRVYSLNRLRKNMGVAVSCR